MRHTPGPWHVRGKVTKCEIGGFFIVWPEGDHAPVGYVASHGDADLFAVAPELLAELRELAALSDDAINEGDPALLGSYRDAAQRLVAKAEGR